MERDIQAARKPEDGLNRILDINAEPAPGPARGKRPDGLAEKPAEVVELVRLRQQHPAAEVPPHGIGNPKILPGVPVGHPLGNFGPGRDGLANLPGIEPGLGLTECGMEAEVIGNHTDEFPLPDLGNELIHPLE